MGIRKLKGLAITFQDEAEGIIKDEDADSIFIESSFFTGWMSKIEFWDLWGTEDDASDFETIPS